MAGITGAAPGPTTVTDETFEREVLASALPVLVEFGADWCGPCRMLAPVLAGIAEETAGALKIVALDVDTNPATQSAYAVLSVPTLMVFRGGEPVKAVVGARSKHRLLQEIAEVVPVTPGTAG
ncbi:thioredoxin [Streptomyces sp. GS7]|uniref:thioredoxin n=1 Tax=Streptomyces sp. GS7 TaxID=2692234 RepID=UPI0013192CDD|nr:thioredoxin [Streptomyces sp. GS7]QHC23102.1 thioredoxin [Streptomyces sp. GS7]